MKRTVKIERPVEIEEYWLVRAIRKEEMFDGTSKQVFKEKEFERYPDLRQILKFLEEIGAELFSVEHKYRKCNLDCECKNFKDKKEEGTDE